MNKLPIYPKEPNSCNSGAEASRNPRSLSRPLPLFYMADYSVLGLLVDNIGEAGRVLKSSKFLVTEQECGSEVTIENPGDVMEIARLLSEHGIECDIADLVDGIYQG